MNRSIPNTFTLGSQHALPTIDFSIWIDEDQDISDFREISIQTAREWAEDIYDNAVEHYSNIIDESIETLSFPRRRFNMDMMEKDKYEFMVRTQMFSELNDDLESLTQYLFNWRPAAMKN